MNEYRLAVQTNDNTQGAVNEARQWLQKPYKLPDSESAKPICRLILETC